MAILRFARQILAAALVAFSPLAAHAATTYTLVPLSDAATPITIQPDGMVTLHLVRSGDRPQTDQTVELTLTEFRDSAGVRVPVEFAGADGKTVAGPLKVTVGGSPIEVRLRVGAIPSPREVHGRILMDADGGLVKNNEIVFSTPRPDRGAKLALNRTSVTLLGEDSPTRKESARFTVSVHDESGQWELRGLHAEIADGGVTEFDTQQITFKVNNHVVENFFSLDADAINDPNRTVPAGASASIDVILPKLDPGHYTPKIRFRAENSQIDPAQVVAIDLNVRTSVGSAVVWLFGGILVSLFVTTWLKARAAVLHLRLRVVQTRPSWFGDADAGSTANATWVRAMFHQAEKLRQFFTVAATEIVDERLTQATQHLPYLEQIMRLRRDIGRAGWPPMVARRALKHLSQINRCLTPGPIDEATGTAIQKDLNDLRKWLDTGWNVPYWTSLKKDLDALRGKADARAFDGTAVESLVEKFLSQISVTDPPKRVVDVEAYYAALKLMWEGRDDPAYLDELGQRWKGPSSIDALFRCADAVAWDKLKKSGSVHFIKPSTASLEALEPFEPMTFEVAPDPQSLGNNYLFKHNLRYEWTISIARPAGWPRRAWRWITRHVPRPVTLTPTTEEPRVVQYVPFPCIVTPSVILCFEHDKKPIKVNEPDKPERFSVRVDGATFKRLIRSVEATELISVGLAMGVGIASGLLTQYFGNNAFGSWRDCIGLFLWGAGSDQAAKSFVDVANRFPRWQARVAPAPKAADAVAAATVPAQKTA